LHLLLGFFRLLASSALLAAPVAALPSISAPQPVIMSARVITMR